MSSPSRVSSVSTSPAGVPKQNNSDRSVSISPIDLNAATSSNTPTSPSTSALTTPSSAPVSSFLALPAEIRNRIYFDTLISQSVIDLNATTSPSTFTNTPMSPPSHALAILAVNKQVHAEAFPVYLHNNRFRYLVSGPNADDVIGNGATIDFLMRVPSLEITFVLGTTPIPVYGHAEEQGLCCAALYIASLLSYSTSLKDIKIHFEDARETTGNWNTLVLSPGRLCKCLLEPFRKIRVSGRAVITFSKWWVEEKSPTCHVEDYVPAPPHGMEWEWRDRLKADIEGAVDTDGNG
ncbi:hypothetical protein EJ05DRAFT_506545 [Pseudovirgaria hyperparasitica]|uniref:Uncharacterized protein n=1 Tax=Pseudovirgaria hyperparasitica TaxID=470096 RepID=A0A6A6WKZ7_9PEZI|nr:uncharacterized protein EJ05DRAFT_506545 [Pseudovirgaria hyperparasitica]KAF2762875.1 hypothetical protein EJ05DRAFT_506545 [Pseudovirgaria hyperparasitica]